MIVLHVADLNLALRVWRHTFRLLNLVALFGDFLSFVMGIVEILVIILRIKVGILLQILSCLIGRRISVVKAVDWTWEVLSSPFTA